MRLLFMTKQDVSIYIIGFDYVNHAFYWATHHNGRPLKVIFYGKLNFLEV